MDPRLKRRRRKQVDFEIDYRDIKVLKYFVTERKKITPSRISGVNAKKQREITTAIKRARHLALLPYCTNHKGWNVL